MSNTYKLQDKHNRLTDTGRMCVLTNGQTITIPKAIRETFSFLAGDEVTVSLTTKPNELVISKLSGDTKDNRMIINERGGIRIPVEIGNFLYLKKGDIFHLYVSTHDQFILLKKSPSYL